MSIQVRVTADNPREAARTASTRMSPGESVYTVEDRDTGQTTTVDLSR
jgi:hypothetical protein